MIKGCVIKDLFGIPVIVNADKLVEECTKNIEEVKITRKNEHKCSSYTLFIVLISIIITIDIGVAAYFVYYKCMNHNKENVSQYVYQTKNY